MTGFFSKGRVNPTVGADYVDHEALGPPPIMEDEHAHDVLMERVHMVVGYAARDQWPTWLFKDWGLSPEVPGPLRNKVRPDEPGAFERSAVMVEMDRSTELLNEVLTWCFDRGVKLNASHRTEPNPDDTDFIGAEIDTVHDYGLKAREAFRATFGYKWLHKCERYEEWLVRTKGYSTEQARMMTAYWNGSPGHPGPQAGHATNAGVVFGVILRAFGESLIRLDLVRELFEACVHFAMYRTLARVHQEMDNIMGFITGCAVAFNKSYDDMLDYIDQMFNVGWREKMDFWRSVTAA